MQLAKFSNKFLPITIITGLWSQASLAYSDFNAHSSLLASLTSTRTAEYMKSVDESDAAIYPEKFKINDIIARWKAETALLSSPDAIVSNHYFQLLVSMGQLAVPFILDDIKEEPSTLVWALNLIYKKKITYRKGVSIAEACKLWVAELKK